jgi:hypothetical protein
MKRVKRILKKSIKILLAIVLVLAVVHGLASFILGRKVEAEIAKIKAKGEPVAMTDLGKNMPPDSENAAVIYEKMFATWPGRQGRYEKYTFDILEPEKRKTDPNAWAEARKIVEQSKHDLAMAEIALDRPACRFRCEWDKGYAMLMPHLAKMRILARLFATRAIVQAKDGRTAEALDSVQSVFKLSESLKDEPVIIGQAVRIRVFHIASRSLRDVVEIASVGEVDTGQLDATLSGIDITSGLIAAMKGERCLGMWGFNHANLLYLRIGSSKSALRLELSSLGKPLLYANELRYIREMTKRIEMANLPSRAPSWQALKAQDMNSPVPNYLADVLTPTVCGVREGMDRGQTQVFGSRILLSLETYRSKNGNYPTKLSDLSIELPKDPFSGKDFIYKRLPNGFLLYSVGWNLKDDGGTPQDSRNDGGDIIWKIER